MKLKMFFMVFVVGIVSLLSANMTFANVVITKPANGTAICSISAVGGSSPGWTTINDIVITEGAVGDFPKNKSNQTITLTAPTGWVFKPATGSASYVAGRDISASSVTVTGTTITLTWTTLNAGGDDAIDVISISGIQVQASSTSSANGSVICTAISQAVSGITANATTGTGFADLALFQAPSIIGNPTNVSIFAGDNTSFTTAGNNSPTGYIWEVSADGGSNWSVVNNGGVYSNATEATLNLFGVTSGMNDYQYRAKAVNGCGTSSVSNIALLVVSYCTPSPSSVDGDGITNITFGTINNTTGTEANNFGDYTAQSTSISQGATATVNITYSTGYTYDTKIWVDWNNDSDFDDAGEEVYSGASTSSNPTTLVATFAIPVGASLGNHRMRIGGQDNGPCTPCYTGTYGTYEDYTINVTAAVPMAFSSCITTQSNVASVAPGATSQEIIGMQVVTTGTATPLTASSFTFNTTGSTAVANIANAKLWTTGSSSAFATTTQLGSVMVSPNGSFTITGGTNMPYTLSTGINYFWLTYDIVASPSVNDVVDAECTSITVGSAQTPTETAPTGSRIIALNYCNPTYSSGGGTDNLTHITLESLDDTPPANNSPYYFNRSATQNEIPTLNIGQTYTLSVTVGTEATQYIRAWIDFNQDGDFDDAGESFDGGNPGTNGTSNISMAIPAGAMSGQTRLRIRGGDDVAIGSGQSCGASSSNFGQALDYSVNIAVAVNMSYVSSTSTQVNTNAISTGSTNQEIICMKVVTSGSLNPLSATEFRMRTDGTTAYATDIRNAKIWFTGNSSSFSTATQFGSTVATPSTSGTDMVFTDNQTLSPGTNYFWMTYDVPSAAVNGNFADAKFQSVVVGGTTQTPTVAEPASNREIIRGCFYTLTLKDDFSNGWDDNTLTVKVNGVTRLNNVSYTSGATYTFQFIAETGQTITTEYTAGTDSQDKSYFITNPNGAYVLSSGEAQTVPANKSATADCNAVKEFTVNGHTYQSGKSCFIITEDKTSKNGSVWSNYKIDMTQNFSIEFDLYLGDDPDGADGVVFALQGSCASAGGDGSSIGFGGINNSIGVEFDTFYNGTDTDDPSSESDHIAIISDGSADHGLTSNLSGPSDVANMEDDAWHPAKVEWNATTKNFSVTYGGSEIMSYTGDIVTNLFAGNSQVFWGFTGSTGGFSNKQQVCITSYPQNTTQVGDTAIDLGSSVSVEVSANAISYTWIPNDGSVSDPSAHNPTLTPTATTEYTCLLEDGCGNIITNKFTVQIKSTLPVELMDFSATCKTNGVDLYWSTASEINNNQFVIEKTNDFVTYTKVATVYGAGNSTSINTYNYLDMINQGLTYYRLTQVDFDGKKTVFNPIAIDCNKSEERNKTIILYPNPATEWFNIGLPSNAKAKVQILTITGMVVNELEEVSSNSKININNLSNGVYIVKVFFENEIYYCKLNKH